MTHRFVIRGHWAFKIQLFWAYNNLAPKSYARWWRNTLPRGSHQMYRRFQKKNSAFETILSQMNPVHKHTHTQTIFYFSTICFNTILLSTTRFPKLSLPKSFLDHPLYPSQGNRHKRLTSSLFKMPLNNPLFCIQISYNLGVVYMLAEIIHPWYGTLYNASSVLYDLASKVRNTSAMCFINH